MFQAISEKILISVMVVSSAHERAEEQLKCFVIFKRNESNHDFITNQIKTSHALKIMT